MKYPLGIVQTYYQSPMGQMRLASFQDKLMGLWFVGQKHEPIANDWPFDDEAVVFASIKKQLDNYFAGKTICIDEYNWMHEISWPKASAFEQIVWQQLLSIQKGHTISYSELATQIGRPKAVRAVASAIGKNPISIIVPCHRVLGKNGSLTGYAGGLERKKALLSLEKEGSTKL